MMCIRPGRSDSRDTILNWPVASGLGGAVAAIAPVSPPVRGVRRSRSDVVRLPMNHHASYPGHGLIVRECPRPVNGRVEYGVPRIGRSRRHGSGFALIVVDPMYADRAPAAAKAFIRAWLVGKAPLRLLNSEISTPPLALETRMMFGASSAGSPAVAYQ